MTSELSFNPDKNANIVLKNHWLRLVDALKSGDETISAQIVRDGLEAVQDYMDQAASGEIAANSFAHGIDQHGRKDWPLDLSRLDGLTESHSTEVRAQKERIEELERTVASQQELIDKRARDHEMLQVARRFMQAFRNLDAFSNVPSESSDN